MHHVDENKIYRLDEIIHHMQETKCGDDNFCLYGKNDDVLNAQYEYLVSEYPKVNDDIEIYPDVVRESNLSYVYSGEQFSDVILSVMEQKSSATLDEYVAALNYFMENDDFLDL